MIISAPSLLIRRSADARAAFALVSVLPVTKLTFLPMIPLPRSAFELKVFSIPPSPSPFRCSIASWKAKSWSVPSSRYGPERGTFRPKVTKRPVGSFVKAAADCAVKIVGRAMPAPALAPVFSRPRRVTFVFAIFNSRSSSSVPGLLPRVPWRRRHPVVLFSRPKLKRGRQRPVKTVTGSRQILFIFWRADGEIVQSEGKCLSQRS